MRTKSVNNMDAKAREIASSCACFKLRKASRAVTQFYDAALQESGLKVTQLTLLVSLTLAGPVPIGTLADELVMDRTTLTRNVELLVRDGLAEVVQGKDKRMKLLQSTEKGRAILDKAIPLWEQAQAALVSRLGKQNWTDLSQKLAAVTAMTVIG
ncbi:MAG TPA: MarR family winged helix-turn-helix transcriptional regulator [Candidatus Obscuribacterales bacterium]